MAAYKLRTPGTFADAATKYRDQFTADGAAAIIGARSASRINQACDPEQVNYTPLGVRQALELDVAFYQRHGYAPTFDVYRRQLAERTTGSAPAISPMVAGFSWPSTSSPLRITISCDILTSFVCY